MKSRQLIIGSILFSLAFITALVALVGSEQPNAMVLVPLHVDSANRASLEQRQLDQTLPVVMDHFSSAVAKGDLPTVKVLVTQGEDVQRVNSVTGRTPLYLAVSDTHLDVATYLIAKGASVRVQDKAGVTPLHLAVESRQPAMVDLLLKNAADPSSKDRRGITPLHIALGNKSTAIIQLLRQSGARD